MVIQWGDFKKMVHFLVSIFKQIVDTCLVQITKADTDKCVESADARVTSTVVLTGPLCYLDRRVNVN